MESVLIRYYQQKTATDHEDFLNALSKDEFIELVNEFKACDIKTVKNLGYKYRALSDLKGKAYSIFNKILWCINKKSKKEWEESCHTTECEIEKMEKAIKDTCLWELIEMEAKKKAELFPRTDRLSVRASAITTIRLKMKDAFWLECFKEKMAEVGEGNIYLSLL